MRSRRELTLERNVKVGCVFIPRCSDVCFTGIMSSNQEDKLLIVPALDMSGFLFSEEKSKKEERNLDRMP